MSDPMGGLNLAAGTGLLCSLCELGGLIWLIRCKPGGLERGGGTGFVPGVLGFS